MRDREVKAAGEVDDLLEDVLNDADAMAINPRAGHETTVPFVPVRQESTAEREASQYQTSSPVVTEITAYESSERVNCSCAPSVSTVCPALRDRREVVMRERKLPEPNTTLVRYRSPDRKKG